MIIPFIEDFESLSSNWIISGQNSSWQIGTPTGIVLDLACRGTGTAVTNLSGNYNNSETSYLETVCITSTQASGTPILSFYINYISEPSYDELILESSIDDGATWQKVNAGTASSNWYANNSSWNENSNGWLKVENYLDSLANQSDFKLRFTFTSDGSGNLEGFAIDDFEIYHANPVSVAENTIQSNVELHPNSNNGNFNLNVSNELVGKQYQIFDIKGGLVKQARIDAANSQIELSNAQKGVYFNKIEGYAKAERIMVL